MRVVSLPRFHLAPSSLAIIALAVVVMLGSALLVYVVGQYGSPLSATPDGPLLGPFRWWPANSASAAV
ncbi:MAG TPA: hypothetical protein VK992_06980 [Candidatus Caenarcaniphilales bacterium]|nr:hypothetical protein [Candidatus Caenarcaniphilales bacterium]